MSFMSHQVSPGHWSHSWIHSVFFFLDVAAVGVATSSSSDAVLTVVSGNTNNYFVILNLLNSSCVLTEIKGRQDIF